MKTYQFCINEECITACKANNETDAWGWFSQVKKLSVEKLKALYTIKQKS